MHIVVIVPTYNERVSIGPLIELLETEFQVLPHHRFDIVVVDGSSPDGTAALVKEKRGRYPNVHLIEEAEKRGLGAAYLFGITYAIAELSADAFIEFDGDSQHNPADVKRLVAELDRGYDYVIGSRYVPGGAVPADWASWRKLASRIGSWLIRWLLKLPTHDNTSGLKLTRVKPFAEYLPLSEKELLSLRHAYKIHLLWAMLELGARVKEIPIIFRARAGGNSKNTPQDIRESLKILAVLCFRRWRGGGRSPKPWG